MATREINRNAVSRRRWRVYTVVSIYECHLHNVVQFQLYYSTLGTRKIYTPHIPHIPVLFSTGYIIQEYTAELNFAILNEPIKSIGRIIAGVWLHY
jgi:hypothetical protein